MDLQLKHRILGAIITVLALAIMLPIVLDQTRHLEVLNAEVPAMPETPEFAHIDNQAQIRQEALELYHGIAEKKLVKPDPVVVEHSQPPVSGIKSDAAGLDSQKMAVAWVVQISAFKDRDNANQQVSQLRKMGYKAFSEEYPSEKITRVFVGPELKRAEIEALQKKLMRDLNQSQILIKRWQPGK